MTLFKRLTIFSILLLTLNSLFALDNKIEDYLTFKITPQFEVASGAIKEYVFDSECKNTDNKLSQLDWNLGTIAIFNLDADFNIIRYIFLGLSGSFAVPQRSDFMQDYDWLNSVGGDGGQFPEWKKEDATELTNFSEQINHLDKFLNFKVRLGGNLYLPLEFTLTPRLTYRYEFIRFTASSGYGEYKSNDFAKTIFTGNLISYEQEMHSVFAGINIQNTWIPHTSININFDISPKTTFLNATDYHYINQVESGTAYLDQFKNLLQIESGMRVQYVFTKNHSAGFAGKLQYIPLSKGQTQQRDIDKKGNFTSDKWIPIDGNGGTERFIWSLCLNYSFSL